MMYLTQVGVVCVWLILIGGYGSITTSRARSIRPERRIVKYLRPRPSNVVFVAEDKKRFYDHLPDWKLK